MSETSRVPGWIKTFLGTLAGIFSGAVVMYLTPLVDKVIKPAKPVANFAVEQEGLTVTVQNRSGGRAEGWWDFGDGSPLEPAHPQQELTSHTYLAGGEYTLKLVLRNSLGDESERSVQVRIDKPAGEPPAILALETTPVSAGAYAPATFRVTSRTKNTQLCVWDVGDDQPLQISSDSPANQEKMVTFWKPGGYVIKMAAVNGGQAVERSEIVYVNEPPNGTVAVTVQVADRATKVETLQTNYRFQESISASSKDNVGLFSRQVPAKPGYEIVDVRLKNIHGPGLQGKTEMNVEGAVLLGPSARNCQLQVSADKRSLRLTGELVRQKGDKASPSLTLPVVIIQERRLPVSRPAVPVASTVSIPGSVLLTLPTVPDNWIDVARQVGLELTDGDKVIWKGNALPANLPIKIQDRRFALSARLAGNQVRIDMTELRPPVAQASP